MEFAITITKMTAAQMATVSAYLESLGAQPATPTNGKGRQAVAELAAAVGATPAPHQPTAPAQQTPPPPPVADPFAAQNPPPPPPPGAPVAGPTGPIGTAAPTTGEIDSKGIPHNPEFHAETKRKNNDGSWAKRKGVNKDACAAWEASLTSRPPVAPPAQHQPAATVAPTAEQINAMHGAPAQPNGHTVPSTSTVPVADPFAAAPQTPPPPAPPAPPAPAPVAVSYGQWFTMYQNLMTAGKLSPETYTEIAGRYGAIEDLMKFQKDDDARAKSYAEFEALAAA
jgi:hypothetical protein